VKASSISALEYLSPRRHLSPTGVAVLRAGQQLPIIDFPIVNVELASILQTLKVTPNIA
jgi:hypothetical protein